MALTSERQRQAELQKAVAKSQQALEKTTQLYSRGLSAYVPVLVAQPQSGMRCACHQPTGVVARSSGRDGRNRRWSQSPTNIPMLKERRCDDALRQRRAFSGAASSSLLPCCGRRTPLHPLSREAALAVFAVEGQQGLGRGVGSTIAHP